MKLSAIICTHNPRRDYLTRVLDALKRQTVNAHDWELLVVDNCSDEAVERFIDLSWCPHARIIAEGTPGTAFARVRGIAESIGDLVLFIDDDNVLGLVVVKLGENQFFKGGGGMQAGLLGRRFFARGLAGLRAGRGLGAQCGLLGRLLLKPLS